MRLRPWPACERLLLALFLLLGSWELLAAPRFGQLLRKDCYLFLLHLCDETVH